MKQRGFMRARTSLALRYGSVAPTESGKTVDLSHRGMSFRCKTLPQNPEIVIRMDTGDKIIDLIGRQRWVEEMANAKYNRYTIGVELVQAPSNYHVMVQKLVYH